MSQQTSSYIWPSWSSIEPYASTYVSQNSASFISSLASEAYQIGTNSCPTQTPEACIFSIYNSLTHVVQSSSTARYILSPTTPPLSVGLTSSLSHPTPSSISTSSDSSPISHSPLPSHSPPPNAQTFPVRSSVTSPTNPVLTSPTTISSYTYTLTTSVQSSVPSSPSGTLEGSIIGGVVGGGIVGLILICGFVACYIRRRRRLKNVAYSAEFSPDRASSSGQDPLVDALESCNHSLDDGQHRRIISSSSTNRPPSASVVQSSFLTDDTHMSPISGLSDFPRPPSLFMPERDSMIAPILDLIKWQ